MDCQLGPIQVKGVSVARKFDEAHRHVFTYTSRLALPDTGLAFQLNVWFVMSERRNRGANKQALFQTFFRLHRDRSSSNSVVSTAGDSPVTRSLEHVTYLEDFILMTRAEELRTKLLCFQSIVLEKFGASCQAPCSPCP